MKKIRIIIPCILILTIVGCGKQYQDVEESRLSKEVVDNIEYLVPSTAFIFPASKEAVAKNYERVNKELLTYSILESDKKEYYNLTSKGIAGYRADESYKRLNNKKYGYVLKDYTYYSELDTVILSEVEAEKLVKKVLPDDIKEVNRYTFEEEKRVVVEYVSEKGEFLVDFPYGMAGFEEDQIRGISYMKAF